MAWTPWLRLKAVHAGNALLQRCDTAGEAIAAFLGITAPKYGYELDAFRRLQRERAASAAGEDAETAAGWTAVRQQDEGHAMVAEGGGGVPVTSQEQVQKY